MVPASNAARRPSNAPLLNRGRRVFRNHSMTQLPLLFTQADEYREHALTFARAGNCDMANIYLHRWLCEDDSGGADNAVHELREACPYPSIAVSIGDPELFK